MVSFNDNKLNDVLKVLHAAPLAKGLTIQGIQTAEKIVSLLSQISEKATKAKTEKEIRVFKVALEKLERLLAPSTFRSDFQEQIQKAKQQLLSQLKTAEGMQKEAEKRLHKIAKAHVRAQIKPTHELPGALRRDIEERIFNLLEAENAILNLTGDAFQEFYLDDYLDAQKELTEKIKEAKTYDLNATFANFEKLLPKEHLLKLQNSTLGTTGEEDAKILLECALPKEGMKALFWSQEKGSWILLTKNKKVLGGFEIHKLLPEHLKRVSLSSLITKDAIAAYGKIVDRIDSCVEFEKAFSKLTPAKMKDTSLVEYKSDRKWLEKEIKEFEKKYPQIDVKAAANTMLPSSSLERFQELIFETVQTESEAGVLLERIGATPAQAIIYFDQEANEWVYYTKEKGCVASYEPNPAGLHEAIEDEWLILPSYVDAFDKVEEILKGRKAYRPEDKENVEHFLSEAAKAIKEIENHFLETGVTAGQLKAYGVLRQRYNYCYLLLKEKRASSIWPVGKLEKLVPLEVVLRGYLNLLEDKDRDGISSILAHKKNALETAQKNLEAVRSKIGALNKSELEHLIAPLKNNFSKDAVDALFFSLRFELDRRHLLHTEAAIVVPKVDYKKETLVDLAQKLGCPDTQPAKQYIDECVDFLQNGKLKIGFSANEAVKASHFYRAVAPALLFNMQKIQALEVSPSIKAKAEALRLKKSIMEAFGACAHSFIFDSQRALEQFFQKVPSDLDRFVPELDSVEFSQEELSALGAHSSQDLKIQMTNFINVIKTRQPRMGTPREGSVAASDFYEYIENSFLHCLNKLQKMSESDKEKAKVLKKEMLHEMLRAAPLCGPRHRKIAGNHYRQIVLGKEKPKLKEVIYELAADFRDLSLQQLVSRRSEEAKARVQKIPPERVKSSAALTPDEYEDVHLANGGNFVHYINTLTMKFGKEFGISGYETVEDSLAVNLKRARIADDKDRLFTVYSSHAIVENLHNEFRNGDLREKAIDYFKENMPYKWGDVEFGPVLENLETIFTKSHLSVEERYKEALEYVTGSVVEASLKEFSVCVDPKSPHTHEALIAAVEDARQTKFLMTEVIDILPKGQSIQKGAIAKLLSQMGMVSTTDQWYEKSELERVAKLNAPKTEAEKRDFSQYVKAQVSALLPNPQELFSQMQIDPSNQQRIQESYLQRAKLANDLIEMAKKKMPEFVSEFPQLTAPEVHELAHILATGKMQEAFFQAGFDTKRFQIEAYEKAYRQIESAKQNVKLAKIAEASLKELIKPELAKEVLYFCERPGHENVQPFSIQNKALSFAGRKGDGLLYFHKDLGLVYAEKQISGKEVLRNFHVGAKNVSHVMSAPQSHIGRFKKLALPNCTHVEAVQMLSNAGAKTGEWLLRYDEEQKKWQQITVIKENDPFTYQAEYLENATAVLAALNDSSNCITADLLPIRTHLKMATAILAKGPLSAEESAHIQPNDPRKEILSAYVQEQFTLCQRLKKACLDQLFVENAHPEALTVYLREKEKLKASLKILESLRVVPLERISLEANDTTVELLPTLTSAQVNSQFLHDFKTYALDDRWILYYSPQAGGLVQTKKVNGALVDTKVTLENCSQILAGRSNALFPIECVQLKFLSSGYDAEFTPQMHKREMDTYKKNQQFYRGDPLLRDHNALLEPELLTVRTCASLHLLAPHFIPEHNPSLWAMQNGEWQFRYMPIDGLVQIKKQDNALVATKISSQNVIAILAQEKGPEEYQLFNRLTHGSMTLAEAQAQLNAVGAIKHVGRILYFDEQDACCKVLVQGEQPRTIRKSDDLIHNIYWGRASRFITREYALSYSAVKPLLEAGVVTDAQKRALSAAEIEEKKTKLDRFVREQKNNTRFYYITLAQCLLHGTQIPDILRQAYSQAKARLKAAIDIYESIAERVDGLYRNEASNQTIELTLGLVSELNEPQILAALSAAENGKCLLYYKDNALTLLKREQERIVSEKIGTLERLEQIITYFNDDPEQVLVVN